MSDEGARPLTAGQAVGVLRGKIARAKYPLDAYDAGIQDVIDATRALAANPAPAGHQPDCPEWCRRDHLPSKFAANPAPAGLRETCPDCGHPIVNHGEAHGTCGGQPPDGSECYCVRFPSSIRQELEAILAANPAPAGLDALWDAFELEVLDWAIETPWNPDRLPFLFAHHRHVLGGVARLGSAAEEPDAP